MKRFYEVAAVIGTLLMSAGLVACGTTAENVTRDDMGVQHTTAVKILLADEQETETETETTFEEMPVEETETQTEASEENAENAEQAENPAPAPAPATEAPPKATTPKSTTKKATNNNSSNNTSGNNSSSGNSTSNSPRVVETEPELEPAPAPNIEPETAPNLPDIVQEVIPEIPETDPPAPTAPPPPAINGDDFTFRYGGFALSLRDNPDGFVSAFAPSQEPLQAPSGSGTDMTYIYNDFTIYAWKDESGNSQLTGIRVTGAGIPTSRGISVGSSAEDVAAAYGSQGGYVYSYNDCTLRFTMENGTVKEISYDYP